MRLVRLLPVLAIAAAGLMSPASASASWSCTYYKWSDGSWHRVALLQEEGLYESQDGNARGESWDCKYCYVPAAPPRGTGSGAVGILDQTAQRVGDLVPHDGLTPVYGLVAQATAPTGLANPFGPPPPCPLVPPEQP
jgi:hypothetical protein